MAGESLWLNSHIPNNNYFPLKSPIKAHTPAQNDVSQWTFLILQHVIQGQQWPISKFLHEAAFDTNQTNESLNRPKIGFHIHNTLRPCLIGWTNSEGIDNSILLVGITNTTIPIELYVFCGIGSPMNV